MLRLAQSLRRPLPAIVFLCLAISFATFVGCGSDDDKSNNGGGTPPTTSSFAGWLANGAESGQLGITVSVPNLARKLLAPGAGRASVAASGTLVLTGTTTGIPLTGTFDDQTGDLVLSGGGYDIAGIYDIGPPGNFVGTYTGPNGSGQFAAASGGLSSAEIYGGSYQSDVSLDGGTFLIAVRGTEIQGVATETGSSTGMEFTGTVSGTGTTRDIAISSPDNGGYTMHGAGTLDTGTHHVSGRFNVDFNSLPADSGSWAGDLVTTP